MTDTQAFEVPPAPGKAAEIGPVCMVTGGAGYVGGIIIRRLLEQGYKVHSFDLNPCPIEDENITSFTGDIRQYDDVAKACEGVNTIFHTAAVISLLGWAKAKVRNWVMDINVAGTAQLIKVAEDCGVERLIYTSTNNVCFDREIINGDETMPYATRPADLYTESKGLAEGLVLAADNGKTGLRTAAVRPGGIWGGSEGGIMITSFLDQIVNGSFKALPGNGKSQAENTHVDNLVDAQILCAEKLVTDAQRVGGEAYYIMDEEPCNSMEWFRPLVEEIGEKWPSINVPAPIMYGVGVIVEMLIYLGVLDMPLSRAGMHKILRTHTFSCAKARRDLGYEPRRSQIEGLMEVAPFAKQYLQDKRAK